MSTLPTHDQLNSGVVWGNLNDHMLGILMKELARRAIEKIRGGRFLFEQFAKASLDTTKEQDIFTNVDREAQEIYLRSLRECTPTFGIIGEEDHLKIPCTHPDFTIYWTLDPLDGTRAFTRRQSHGIGTMLALVCNGRVIAAIVGDVMTRELFYTRPGSARVHRLSDFAFDEVLTINPERSLASQYLLLRAPLSEYPRMFQDLHNSQLTSTLCKSYQIADGSIGTMMARLWKGEIGAVMLEAGMDTPWDTCPVLGLSERLGFVFLKGGGDLWKIADLTPPLEVCTRNSALLVIHGSRLPEFKQWCARAGHQY